MAERAGARRHGEHNLGNQFIGRSGSDRHRYRIWPDRTDLWRRGHHRLFARQPKQSILVYKKKNHYNEWEFTYDPLSDMQTMSGGNTGTVGQPASSTTSPVGGSSFGSPAFDPLLRPARRLSSPLLAVLNHHSPAVADGCNRGQPRLCPNAKGPPSLGEPSVAFGP